jgi:hypothetical protein
MKAALAIFKNRFVHVSAIVLLLCGSFLTAQDAQGSGQQSHHPEANSYSCDSRTAQENAVDWKTKGITPHERHMRLSRSFLKTRARQ